MIVKEYISQRFRTFGIQLTNADLLDMCMSSDVGMEDEMDKCLMKRVNVSMADFIPTLLLRATSINESGFSMSWNIQGIKEYYAYLCKKYGLRNELDTDKPKIRYL